MYYVFIDDELQLIDANGNNWDNPVYDAIKENIREYLIHENEGRCFYCKTILKEGTCLIPIEHIVDKDSNSDFVFESLNLTIACPYCNSCKGNKDVLKDNLIVTGYPMDRNDFLIVHAYFDDYYDHIQINNEFIIVGKTDKGHFTIDTCKLFRTKLAEEKIIDSYNKINSENIGITKKLLPRFSDLFDSDNDLHVCKAIYNSPNFDEEKRLLGIANYIIDNTDLFLLLKELFISIRKEKPLNKVYEKIQYNRELHNAINNLDTDDLLRYLKFLQNIPTINCLKSIKLQNRLKKIIENENGSTLSTITLEQIAIKLNQILQTTTNYHQDILQLVSDIEQRSIKSIRANLNTLIETLADVSSIIKSLTLFKIFNRHYSIKSDLLKINKVKRQLIGRDIDRIFGMNPGEPISEKLKIINNLLLIKGIFEITKLESSMVTQYSEFIEKKWIV